MMPKITYQVISLLLIVNNLACSRVKEYLPDKEKDYQLTTEIPELLVPPDLSNEAIHNNTSIQIDSEQTNSVVIQDNESINPVRNNKDEAIYVDLVEYSGGATRIRIEDSIDRSWRTVGKALSRHSIEITDRNELDRVYFVQYDPDFKKVEDGSLWDEALFLFGADPSREKEYRVRLSENGSLTEIIVLDINDKPLSTGTGLKLLNLLYKTIKDDLVE